MAIGSMNTVAPVDDWSCIIPGKWFLYSALTGIQYLPFLMVTRLSWNMVCLLVSLTSFASWLCSFSFVRRLFRLTALSPDEASSAISFSDTMHLCISLDRCSSGMSSRNLVRRLSGHVVPSGFMLSPCILLEAFSSSICSLLRLLVSVMLVPSFSPYLLAVAARSNMLATSSSSAVVRIPSTSSLFRDAPISLSPANDRLPWVFRRRRASLVSC